MSSLYSSVQVPRDSSHKLISSKTFSSVLSQYTKMKTKIEAVDMPTKMLEFIDDDGLRATEHILDNSESFLDMYENALDLTSEVKNFGDFIGNFDFFGMNYCEPYNHTLHIYKNLKDEEFINRKDVFPLIQSCILRCVPDMRHDLTITILSLFLRFQENRMGGGYMEFIKYSDDLLHDFSQILCSEEFKKKLNDVPKGKRLVPLNKTAANKLWFEFANCEVLDEAPSTMPGFYNQEVYWKWQVTMNTLEKYIATRYDLFSSNKRYRTVRLFEDGPERFVFGNELAIALDKKYTEQNEFKMMVVQDQFLERLPHIDFIRTPVCRTKYRSIPIISPSCHYAILSSDALVELLHQLIDMEIFACSTPESVKLALNEIEDEFCVNGKTKTCCSFFGYDGLAHGVHQILLKDATTGKTVRRSALSNGFTLKDFMEVIEYIELNTVFPNILQYAPMAYKHVNDCKPTEILKTSDFLKCLKICQMMSIMEMAPNLRTYLHDQKACNNVIGIECTQCPQILRQVFASQNGIVKSLRIQEEELTEKPEPDDVLQKINVDSEKKKKVKGKKEASLDKPSTSSSCDEGVESADEVVVNRQSNNCVKCFRTNVRCNEVKEELKQISKIISQQNIEIEEKKAKIQEKKAKIEEQNAKIQELMAQIAALQSSQQVPVVVPEMSQNMKDILFDFQTKRNVFLKENPVAQLSQKVFRLNSKVTNKKDKMGAEAEFKKFCNNYEKYMNALEVNINRIQSRTRHITPSDLLKVPEFPTLSSGFLEAYERIVTKPEEEAASKKKKEEEEREKECQICYNDMTSSEKTLKCPHCPKTYHSSCISDWINVSPTCPNCRGKFLNPTEYPPLC